MTSTQGGGIGSMASVEARKVAQTLIDRHDNTAVLPLPLMELLDLLLGSLDPSVDMETKETVLRSLRSCSSRVTEGHDRVLQRVTPLLVDPSLALRHQSAGCVLQYSSTATTSTLRKHSIFIASTISKALSPLQYTSQHSVLRLVSTCLRILNVLCSKLSPVSPEVATTVIPILGVWIYYRPGIHGGVSPAPDRGRPAPSGSALAFGVMGAFLPSSSRKTKTVRSISRSSSKSSLGGGASEEEEEGQVEQRKHAVQVRLDALTCLRTIAVNDPKTLYTRWNLFFADSPYLSQRSSLISLVENDSSSTVRLRACAAMTAMLEDSATYLSIAEDRPTKASFTSLSSRLGELVAGLHLKLQSLLSSPALSRHRELLVALLKLAGTLGANSPYRRMARPLAQPLASAVVPFLQASDMDTAAAAATALTSIARNAIASAVHLDVQEIVNCLTSLLKSTEEGTVQIAAWTSLGVIAGQAERVDWDLIYDMFPDCFATSSPAVQEAQMEWIASVFRTVERSPDPSAPRTTLRSRAASLLEVLKSSLTSERPQLRVLACGLLASPLLCDFGSMPFDPLAETQRRSTDDEAAVRSAASRTLGVLVKSTFFDPRLLKAVLLALISRCSDVDSVVNSACWSLANCCDVLTTQTQTAELLDYSLLLTSVVPLGTASAGDRIQPNGLRALGSLLKAAPADASISAEALAEVVETLCEGLQTGPAKVRWNAASAIASTLASSHLAASTSNAHLRSLLLDSLSSNLSSAACANYKVRIQAASGLMVPSDRASFGVGEAGQSALECVRQKVDAAREELKEGDKLASNKERGHFEQLVDKLEKCSLHLTSLATQGD